YINYGVFHNNLGNYELAIDQWLNAVNILNSIGIKNQLALTCYNIGDVYIQICDYQKSYDYLIKAFNLFDEIGSEEEKIHTLVALGKLWYTLGDFEQVYKAQDKIEQLSSKIINNEGQNYFYLNILKYLLELNPKNTLLK